LSKFAASRFLNLKGNLSDYRNRKLLVDILFDRIIPQFTQRNYQLVVKLIQNFRLHDPDLAELVIVNHRQSR